MKKSKRKLDSAFLSVTLAAMAVLFAPAATNINTLACGDFQYCSYGGTGGICIGMVLTRGCFCTLHGCSTYFLT